MKRATNVSIDSGLLEQAKGLGINLSRSLEDILRARIAEARAVRWREENARAIAAHNDRVAKKGMFSDRLRRF